MTTSIYIFIFSLLAISLWVGFKYYRNLKDVELLTSENESGGVEQPLLNDNLAEAKELAFDFFEDIWSIVRRQVNLAFHRLLHLFVILLGFISDFSDYIYSHARDLFLRTATKEKEVVTKFWPHLKEYKKEQNQD